MLDMLMMIFYYIENPEEKNDNYLLKNRDTLEELNNNENVVTVFREKLFKPIRIGFIALIPLVSNNIEVC